MKRQNGLKHNFSLVALFCLTSLPALAVEIEPAGKAISAILQTTKAFKKTMQVDGKPVSFFYSKDASGKVAEVVFIEHGTYEPNCTHTWAIGMNPDSQTVTEVRVIEMYCPHAFPTKSSAFLDQFKGKGPADVATLDTKVTTVAKATGSSNLAIGAVKRSIVTLQKIHGSL
jgi:hypothetical protein